MLPAPSANCDASARNSSSYQARQTRQYPHQGVVYLEIQGSEAWVRAYIRHVVSFGLHDHSQVVDRDGARAMLVKVVEGLLQLLDVLHTHRHMVNHHYPNQGDEIEQAQRRISGRYVP